MEFTGLMPPVFTPFNDDFSINLSVIPEYVDFLQKRDVKGILVNGTSGEGMSMSVEERKLLAECWIKEAHKYKMHVMIQVGGAPLPDVITLAKHAEQIKADSILTLPELFNKPTNTKELIDYLKIISDAAPNTPLLYYHNPGFTNVDLYMPPLVKEAKERISTFRGLKFTSMDLIEGEAVLNECGDDCTVFLGADQMLIDAFALGFNSSIGTTFNMMLQFGSNIRKYTKKLEISEMATVEQEKLNQAIKLITSQGKWVPSMKAAMEIMTCIKVGPTRPPTAFLTKVRQNYLSRELGELKSINK